MWVSVDTALPNEGEAVLVWDGSRGMLGSIEVGPDNWFRCRSYFAPVWNNHRQRWIMTTTAEQDDKYTITHWCRFPKPPL